MTATAAAARPATTGLTLELDEDDGLVAAPLQYAAQLDGGVLQSVVVHHENLMYICGTACMLLTSESCT